MSVPSYNLAGDHEASYSVSQDGNTTVSVRNAKHLNFRAVYVGAAALEFGWVSTGKSAAWQCTETISDPTPAQHSETLATDDETQTINVDLGNRVFPAWGLTEKNMKGSILAPAIHFDLPHAYDLWVFLLRSPWFPIKIRLEKSSLNISHSSAQATAQIENVADAEGGQSLRADVSVHGEGFKKVTLVLRRTGRGVSAEQVLGEVTGGMETLVWKPTLRNFNLMLVTSSKIDLFRFADFLKYMGAETKIGSFAPTLQNDFVVCDGLDMTYSLSLIGEKHLLSHERDETALALTP